MKRPITKVKLLVDYSCTFTEQYETELYETSFKKGDIVPVAKNGDAITPGAAAAMISSGNAEPVFDEEPTS